MIFVDTSVIVSYLRGENTEATKKFEILESKNIQFAIPAICVQELLQGVQSQQEWKSLERYLVTQNIALPTDPLACHISATKIKFQVRKKGYTVKSMVDCFIAALCLEQGARLLHQDRDFEVIGRVCGLKGVE